MGINYLGAYEVQAICADCDRIFATGSPPKRCQECGSENIEPIKVWRELPKVQGLTPHEVVVAMCLPGNAPDEVKFRKMLRRKRYMRRVARYHQPKMYDIHRPMRIVVTADPPLGQNGEGIVVADLTLTEDA